MYLNHSLKRLDFTLSSFTRIAWVSDYARSVWEPRLQSVAEKRLKIKLRMLQDGCFSCITHRLAAWEYLRLRETLNHTDLQYAILETVNAYEPEKMNAGFVKPISFKIVIGSKNNVEQFESAFHSGNLTSMAELLGIPACCRDFYNEKQVKDGWKDLSWFRAVNTHSFNEDRYIADVTFLPQLNLCWKALGIGAIAYQPCSFCCKNAENSGDAFFKIGESLSLLREIEWLQNILSWPVEWTALHGIAEIKTPVLRISTNTDATAQKLIIKLQGDIYPEEGAKGLNFPFQVPEFKRITDSKSFKMGLENEIRKHN